MDSMDHAAVSLAHASHQLYARAGGGTPEARPPAYKAVGISLAIASGVFIGISFVMKKVGLLKANVKYNEEAGEGYGYLKNFWWWGGMTLMIIGEVCNFVAYAFVDAILVTPLGALSVVITTILSAIFLKERLSFVGKAGCFICIIGSIIIVLNAPAQSSVRTIQDMQHYVIHPAFLTYAGVIIVGCLFTIFWAGPRYGKKSMMVYLTVCSLIGGLSVVATQGLGAAVVAQAGGTPQFNQWFLYVLLVFVVGTLLTEIIFLNKALNIFNAALVTPTYYVYFTSATIVSSAVLFRGFKGTPTGIATIVMGFLVICTGVVLLQLSKSAKDVPDAAVFAGETDQIRTIAEQEQPESEPKADAIRGTAALVRRISKSRQHMEAEEAKRVYEDRMRDTMEPINENEQVEWDGVRRRKTLKIDPQELHRRKSMHPPLGLTKFPSYDEDQAAADHPRPRTGNSTLSPSLFSFRRRTSASERQGYMPTPNPVDPLPSDGKQTSGRALEKIPSEDVEMQHIYGLPPGLAKSRGDSHTSSRVSPGDHSGKPILWGKPESKATPSSPAPPKSTRRQFSFQNLFQRSPSTEHHADLVRPKLSSRPGSAHAVAVKNATEEEMHGLVKGDSQASSEEPSENEDPRYLGASRAQRGKATGSATSLTSDARSKELEAQGESQKQWSGSSPEVRTPGGGRPLPKTPAGDESEDESGDYEKRPDIRPLDSARRRDGR